MFHSGFGGSQTGNDLWILPVSGKGAAKPFLATPFNEENGRLSPDGRWVAYESDQSGRREVYVVPFPGPGGRWQVSTNGGTFPRWRKDGRELFYVGAGGTTLMSAMVSGSGTGFEIGAVQRLFELPLRTDPYLGFGAGYTYDVFPDGQQFNVDLVAEREAATTKIRVVTNWNSTAN